jgi:hypothetical protein
MKPSSSIVDTIVQGATVDLFRIYGVAVAPVPRAKRPSLAPPEGFCGTITFSGKGFTGSLTLFVPAAILSLTKAGVVQALHPRDWIRELTNQLMGRIKTRLLHLQVTLQTGLPSAMDRRLIDPRRSPSGTVLIYEFRTIREEVMVTLEGTFDESALKYSGGANPGSEGDVIIF